ncbi:MAG: SAP domain-containing protein, partial [Candidatus Poseidoniales archaeon]|nr:SAP domain-containing protein [Candidatus Poseidoniales archaeon]
MSDEHQELTVSALKDLLRERGLNLGGKKADLIARLDEAGVDAPAAEEDGEGSDDTPDVPAAAEALDDGGDQEESEEEPAEETEPEEVVEAPEDEPAVDEADVD